MWAHFIGTGAEEYRRMLLESTPVPVFHLRKLETLVEAFEETYRYVLGGFTNADLLGLSTSLARFLSLCRLHQLCRGEGSRDAGDKVLRVIRFMRVNLHRVISLHELAQVSGWSDSHFCALFRRQTNPAGGFREARRFGQGIRISRCCPNR